MVIRGEVIREVRARGRGLGGAADQQRGQGRGGHSVRGDREEPLRVRGARRVPPLRGLHELYSCRREAVPPGGQ